MDFEAEADRIIRHNAVCNYNRLHKEIVEALEESNKQGREDMNRDIIDWLDTLHPKNREDILILINLKTAIKEL